MKLEPSTSKRKTILNTVELQNMIILFRNYPWKNFKVIFTQNMGIPTGKNPNLAIEYARDCNEKKSMVNYPSIYRIRFLLNKYTACEFRM